MLLNFRWPPLNHFTTELLIQFDHSRELETAGAYYDKYKDFKLILATSVLFKLFKLVPKTILK